MSFSNDMWDVSTISVQSEQPAGSGADFFSPKPEKGKQGVYEAVVRFVPFLKDKDYSIIKKHETYLTHPNGTRKGVYSYRSIGAQERCPIVKTYWELHNSKDASINEQKKKFEQKEKWWCLIQILQDDNDPTSVGKIKVWNFGWTIIKKIQDQTSSKKPRNPFDVINGRPMRVKVITKAGYPEYSGCEFQPADDFDIPVYLGENGEGLDVSNAKDLQKYGQFLMDNSPDITKFKFKEWDEETTTFVNECIDATLTGKVNVGNIKSSMRIDDEEEEIITTSKKSAPPKRDKNAEDLVNVNVSKKTTTKTASIDDDISDEDFDFSDEDFDIED